jgi:NADPH:quinone reductase-like Zn-dependent oxidoreductase
MRAYELRGGFGVANLALVDRPEPRPAAGQVLLAIKAVSINYRDVLMVRGTYNPRQALPLVPLSDAAAEVLEVGPGVTRWRAGDRVLPLFAQGWLAGEATREQLATTLGGPLDGTLRERMVVHEDALVATPAHLTDEQAATLPCAALTAWSALVTRGGVRAGDVVLTLGTGGVSLFALQLARLHGATVIVTSKSDEKLARAKALGAAHGLNYGATPQWGKEARALASGVGVDHVIEVGGVGTLEQSLRAVRPGGTVSLIGVLAGYEHPVNLTPVLMQNIRIQGVMVGHRESFLAMNRALAQHRVVPVVDRVFAFTEAREALEYAASGQQVGKVCVRVA